MKIVFVRGNNITNEIWIAGQELLQVSTGYLIALEFLCQQ